MGGTLGPCKWGGLTLGVMLTDSLDLSQMGVAVAISSLYPVLLTREGISVPSVSPSRVSQHKLVMEGKKEGMTAPTLHIIKIRIFHALSPLLSLPRPANSTCFLPPSF